MLSRLRTAVLRPAPVTEAPPEEPDATEVVLRKLDAARRTRRVPLTDAPVAVAGSTHVRDGLGQEWPQTDLPEDRWRTALTPEHALLVVEVDGAQVAGWSSGTSPADLAAVASALGVPSVAWVTGAEPPAAEVDGFDRVLTLPPATAVRTQSPDRAPGEERPGAVLVRHESTGGTAYRAGTANDTTDLTESLSAVGLVAHDWDLADDGAPSSTQALSSQYAVLADVGRRAPAATWPVLDALASRTAVVTTPERAAGLPEELRAVVAVAEPHEIRRTASVLANQAEYRDRATQQGLRAVLAGHTFTDRARSLLEAAGAAPAMSPSLSPSPRTVSVVVPTNRPHELDNVLANVARQERVDVELIVVAHGIDVDAADLRARAAELGVGEVTVVPATSDQTLGAILNLGIDVAGGAYVAKMDDDNFYGGHFLGDLVDAFASTSAGITGKWAHYVWLRSSGAVVLRFEKYENTYHRLVQGGSIVATRDVALDIRFSDIPRAVDSDFLNRAMAAGVQTYSADRYNFVSIRGDDRLSHTWKVDDLVFMTGAGRVVTYGDPRELVSV
ncbi:glycosyltransferase [Ornithinimicrobium tianjinense]|uniref:Glycosyltransferase 2-like domain-containing protein n=1 Tax=Ornithinimicrobium tianjinense TaxID=1195761 RepID=A0A917F888_9MICO|nr:glycosyltransferase [Ornithinimicrobium tianjinense]GGF52752.1 hypothetical protein GCM10011366_20700 [Ornithinimicrobium tianjinense]